MVCNNLRVILSDLTFKVCCVKKTKSQRKEKSFYLGYKTLGNGNWVGVTLLQVMKQITETHTHSLYIVTHIHVAGLSRYETIQNLLQLCGVL